MKKIRIALMLSILATLVSALKANAACIPPQFAVSAVAGRTYVFKDSPNSQYQEYITFSSANDLKATFRNTLDGQPMGQYHFHGNCHGEVILTSTSDFELSPASEEVFRLRPMDSEYFQLRSVDGKIFNIVTGL